MIRFLLKLSLIFILAFTALSIAARALGASQPPNPALAGLSEGCEDKPQPCWYGIVPGVTTVEEAGRLAIVYGYSISELKPASSDLGVQHSFVASPPVSTAQFSMVMLLYRHLEIGF